MTEQIAFYGKGGVGTSTLVSNISAALVEAGFRVMLISRTHQDGSSSILTGGIPVPTIWESYEQYGSLSYDTAVHRGFKGIYCIDLGGPAPEMTTKALELLRQYRLIESISPDFVLYDVAGEHAVGDTHPILVQGGLNRVFAVTTADFMSLGAANSLLAELERSADSHVPLPFGGLIPNGIGSSFEESFVADFAKHTRTHTLGRVPRSLMVRQCELYGKTVIEASPLSNQSYFYRRLANQIFDESRESTIKQQPAPMLPDQLRDWAREWGDRLYALENGLVADGAAI